MTYRGHVKDGVVVLDDPGVTLPDGVQVEIALVQQPMAGETPDAAPTLFERLEPVMGAAQGLPPDAAANVDHYLYGHPKR